MGRSRAGPVADPSPESDHFVLHALTSGSGPALVLVHGVAGSNMVWDRMVPLLDSHFTVVRVDLLGYGHSAKPHLEYTPWRHVSAIRRTLTASGVAPPYGFIGLSMGTNLMLEYARRWPGEVGDMVGLGFPYYPSEAAARVGLRNNPWTRIALGHPAFARLAIPSLWALGRHTSGLFSGRSTIYTGAMAKDALRVRYHAFRSSLLCCMVHYRLDEPLEASGDKPRLFIHGDDDEWATSDAVRRALAPYPQSELRTVENGPHNLAVAEPERTAALILDHLRRH